MEKFLGGCPGVDLKQCSSAALQINPEEREDRLAERNQIVDSSTPSL